jgi:NADPH-dependent F420 reductase
MTDRLILTLGILGGTGNVGKGLAYRWAKAGYHVIIGSRSAEKAVGVAEEVNQRFDRPMVVGKANDEATAFCDIAVLTVPYSAHRTTLEALREKLQGKLLIDVTVPLVPPEVTVVQMPPAGSATQEAQDIVGDGVQVVAAFQNVSYAHLSEDSPVPCDVLICGDSEPAKEQVLQLISAAGLVGWDAGPLRNAMVIEGLTSLLIGINKRHNIKSAGIRITGEQRVE